MSGGGPLTERTARLARLADIDSECDITDKEENSELLTDLIGTQLLLSNNNKAEGLQDAVVMIPCLLGSELKYIELSDKPFISMTD